MVQLPESVLRTGVSAADPLSCTAGTPSPAMRCISVHWITAYALYDRIDRCLSCLHLLAVRLVDVINNNDHRGLDIHGGVSSTFTVAVCALHGTKRSDSSVRRQSSMSRVFSRR